MAAATHVMFVSTEPEAGRGLEFESWYCKVHSPQVLEVAGVESAERYSRDATPDGNGWLTLYWLSEDPNVVQVGLADADFVWSDAYSRDRTVTSFYRIEQTVRGATAGG